MISEFKNGKISEDVKEGVLALYLWYFFIFKDVFNRNSQGGSLPMGFRRGGSGSNVGGVLKW